ncbi:MAG: carboxypeptidase regulatory-like domain-containing protein [Chitinophagaceae bacterium]|nr:carboxypeptidase regulatory-like domain-containing protein [Chitinophagaceae bacterium]
MNSKYESKLNMYRAVKQICDEYNTTLSTNTGMSNALNTYKLKLTSLINTVASEAEIIKGIAIDKKMAKSNLSQLSTEVAAIIWAYASEIGNFTLQQSVHYSFTDLSRMKDDLLSPICQNIYNVANDNSAVLIDYGMTPTLLVSLQTAIDDYSVAVPKPRSAKSIKMVYTQNIAALIKEINSILKNRLDKLSLSFNSTDPDFVKAYFNARIIIDPNTTTTQLKGKITDAEGNPLKMALVSIVGQSITPKKTSVSGNFSFKPIPHGSYQIQVSLEGYEPITLYDQQIKMGQINKLNIILQAA